MNQEKESLDLPKLKLGWDERRTERLLASVHARLDRRRRARLGVLTAAALTSVVALVIAVRWSPLRSNVASSVESGPQVAARESIKLREGSVIEIDRTKSELRVVEESPSRVRVELVRGSGRYSVVPNPGRTFEVRSGAVTVTVVGTEFSVEQQTEGTRVEVFRGKVRVAWGTEEAFVAAGEGGIFPPPSIAAAPGPAEPHGEIDPPAARSQATQAYRARVAHHDYRGAYAVLARNPALAGDTVEDLLVAADVARLSDHPSEALPYLQRVVREHPRDERAPLAAFTLGRTLLGLGRTQEAMAMFGRVRTSWPKSPLAEDALLRQAEAASQMGDVATARRIAEQYDHDYPNGRRRAEARRYARLE